MNKRSEKINRVQNITIVLLSISFVLLLTRTPLFGSRGDALVSTMRGWLSARQPSAAEETAELSALAVPVRVVQTNDFIRSGSDVLTTADSAFEAPGSFLGEAVGSARSLTAVPERAFLSALEGSGLYFEFVSALPLEILSARLGVTTPSAQQINVRRCLLSADTAGTVHLYLQDEGGSCFRFSTAVSAVLLAAYLEAQDGGSVEFAFAMGEEYAALSPYTLVFSAQTEREELSAANALSDYSAEELLRRAEFNPHTKDWYRGSSGTVVYIEGQRKLYLEPDGVVSYGGGAAEDGSLFSVAAADAAHPSRAELCAAARSLIETLAQGRTGDAALYVSGMRTEDSVCIVTFDYLVGGTPLRFSDGSHAAEVRLEGRSITAFSLRLRRYTVTERSTPLLPPALACAIARNSPGSELSVAYVDSYGDSVSAGWVADRDAGREDAA